MCVHVYFLHELVFQLTLNDCVVDAFDACFACTWLTAFLRHRGWVFMQMVSMRHHPANGVVCMYMDVCC